MRALIIAAAATLAFSACGKKDQTEANQAADQGFTADSIVSNDVTAIDAVTGDAANMAADVNYQDFDNSVGDTSSSGSTAKASGATSPKSRQPDEPATTSSASNATENITG